MLLVQLPVPVSLRVLVSPTHAIAVPVIACGAGLTVKLRVVTQNEDSWYVMVTVPAATPVTMPVPDPIVATAVLLLLHAPKAVRSLRLVEEPTHWVEVPVIGAGEDVIDSPSVAIQPVGNAYVIVAVPAATPVTIPEVPTVAIDVLLLLQVPPVVASVRLAVEPIQYTDVVPPIGAGSGLMVITLVAIQPVGRV